MEDFILHGIMLFEPIALVHPWLGKSFCVHSLHCLVFAHLFAFVLGLFCPEFQVAVESGLVWTSKGLAWGKLMCSF